MVVVASRDILDQQDIIQCFDAESGEQQWIHAYPAPGKLDYGNSPRATPLVDQGNVYVLGAFGHLTCLELESGLRLWQRNLASEFQAEPLTWGHSGSPVMVDDRLILQPGGKRHSVVALDPENGETIWSTPGAAASYSSLVPARLGDRTAVIGLDADSLGAWDTTTGQRIWSVAPDRKGDFNVPTPLVVDNWIGFSTENNGTRIFPLQADGLPANQPSATDDTLVSDTNSPVMVRGMIVGACNSLIVLDPGNKLAEPRILDDPAFGGCVSLIAGPESVLALAESGELTLVGFANGQPEIRSRLKLSAEPQRILSHPAMAGDSIYIRLEKKLVRLRLGKP